MEEKSTRASGGSEEEEEDATAIAPEGGEEPASLASGADAKEGQDLEMSVRLPRLGPIPRGGSSKVLAGGVVEGSGDGGVAAVDDPSPTATSRQHTTLRPATVLRAIQGLQEGRQQEQRQGGGEEEDVFNLIMKVREGDHHHRHRRHHR